MEIVADLAEISNSICGQSDHCVCPRVSRLINLQPETGGVAIRSAQHHKPITRLKLYRRLTFIKVLKHSINWRHDRMHLHLASIDVASGACKPDHR